MRLVREAMAFFRGRGRTLGTLAALSVVAAQIESVALVTVAMTVGAVARGDTEVSLHLGPVSAHLSTAAATLMVLILFVVTASITAIFVLIQSSVAASVERHYRDRIVASFATADWTTQSRQRTGRLNGQLKLAAAAPQTFSSLTIWIRSAATVVVFLVAALVVSPVTTLVTAALGAAFSVMVLPLRRRLRRIVAVGTGGELEFAQEFAEGAEMAQDLRVFSGWPRLIDRLSVISSRLETLRRSIHIIGSSLPLSYQYGGPIVILGVVAVLSTVSGTVEIAPLAAVALLLLRCAQYGQSVQGAQQILAESVTILDALERELAAFQVNRAGDEGVHLDPVTRLSLHDLSYTYPGSTKPALEQVNLELAARTVVGVVGPSGGGKSTLAQILLRLREPTQGQLIVNGLAADEYSEQSWYARVSHVPQQPRLLHATVAENIAFLDESIARADIDAAGKKVGLDEFVRQLPNGYDTPIGPAMHNLSGGQAQRIGIARALVRNPDVLILDEPTSALDSSSEMLIQRALEQLKRDSDVLLVIIAHRLSTLSVCDELVVLDGGRIKVHGTLTEALEASTYFREALEASTLKV